MKMKFECEKTEQKIHTAQTELLREEERKISVYSLSSLCILREIELNR